MAQIVAAFAASHSPFMMTREVANTESSSRIFNGFKAIRSVLYETRATVMVVFADDHFRHFFMDNMPPFCIGIGECRAAGDFRVPEYAVPVERTLGMKIVAAGLEAEFDFAYSRDLLLDHGFMVPLHLIRPEMDIPLVPIVINTNAAPLPSLRRCYEVGKFVRRVVHDWPTDERVAVAAFGGLSHAPAYVTAIRPPEHLADWQVRMLDIQTRGKGTVKEDAAFREHVAHTYNRLVINAEFDRQCLAWLAAGDADSLCRLTFDEIEEKAGNGGHEIRNWIAMLGTVAGATGTVIAYEPVTEWICGMGQLVMSV